jgi:putative membrane protein
LPRAGASIAWSKSIDGGLEVLAVLLQMMDRDDMHDGGGYWWAWLIGAAVLVVLVGLVVFAVIRMSAGSPRPGGSGAASRRSAEDLLAERFARGEIDEQEYRDRRDALRE